MNNSSSLERRYSFNMAQGGHAAESTHLNLSSFSWGSVCPQLRSNSNLNNSTINSYLNCEFNAKPNIRVTKVDARIAADTQSNGLTSRIVKYHDSGTRLYRSMSAHNLFNKPGQFPVVTLKKTNLPYRAAKRELSMIRIPPPEKSSFYGNTVSSLLRSSSVIGLQSKQNEVLSTENRPIIHPPPTENDMAPTRSVLDVLKEISRKRINSDELESEEMSKKYCSRASNDFVDTVANKALANQQDFVATSSFSPCQRYKRQRDNITSNEGLLLVETKTSPEQAKKRVCNYNNDITSSLSSSIKCKKITTRNLYIQPYETQKSKEQLYLDHQIPSNSVDLRLKPLESNWKNFENSSYMPQTSVYQEQIKTTETPKRALLESFSNSDEQIGNVLTPIDLDRKPRLTLFNKNYDNESLQELEPTGIEEKNVYSHSEENCIGIPFVKPKKIASKSGLRNSVMERTQKSKLALMLSGLRGELYQNTEFDEFDSSIKNKEVHTTAKNSTMPLTSSVTSTNSIATLTKVTPISNVETITDVKTLSPPSLPLAANKKSSPLVGLKLKPSTENVSSTISTDNTKNTDLQCKSNVPVLGGFSFSATSSNSTSSVQTSLNIKSESKITSAQMASTPTTNNIETITQLSSSLTNDKTNEISGNMQLPINNLVKFPAVCKESPLSMSNENSAVTSSSLAISKPNSLISECSTSPTPTKLPVYTTTKSNSTFSALVSTASTVYDTSTISIANPTNSYNFTLPSLSSPSLPISSPLLFGSSSDSGTLTKPTVLNFNTKPLAGEMAKTSSEGTPSISLSIDGNKSANSVNVFGAAIDSSPKPLVTCPAFTFNSNTTNPGAGAQSNQKEEIKDLKSTTTAPSDLQHFNSNTTKSSINNVINVGKSSENNIFNPSGTTSIFGSNSVKANTEAFRSNSNGKSGTPTVFGNDKTVNSMPFSFGSNIVTFADKSSNEVNTNNGGFSFTSAVSNNAASGEKSSSHNMFNGNSLSASQNNFMFDSSSNKPNSSNVFGASGNKPAEILPQGGFSFVSTTPLKTSTFNFGAGKTNGNNFLSSNNPLTSFNFGASSDTKQNMMSNNKTFSFGSPQPMHQKQSDSTNIGNSPNMFGLSAASKVTQPPAFNFNSASSQPNAPPTNIFAPTPSNVTTGPGDRPIRRATRRLQK